ncbi:MAG: hypothetical protein A3A26_01900 [Candidatus Zambryskibacteria bacterium RIFCSPLOWO2_01_FULL_47_14]|uniref:DUF676 domain-containing protein n=1 Tax=Candidatus Zambryskibacteria bacterium RIFCSPLOWO2_01_FULL_47_14 TaxID=1802763 RepID=A0A1G2U8I8_9BACT|nr:MAG: hypothetical protein A3A26_01900 [Candidatus Zambryskibacteria bacterium RIFCSPLOWO2_01_FULL_47_14]
MRKLFLFLIVFDLFFNSTGLAFAEVVSPYEIDFKSRALFADSTSTAEYYGLENYATEYVGGHLRITFTYTHLDNQFTSYPPFIHLTNSDPRSATTSAVVRSQSVIHRFGWDDPTDWYSYDIQFDATGYTVTAKQAASTTIATNRFDNPNATSTDWAALANGYPRQDPITDYSMAFEPVPVYSATPPAEEEEESPPEEEPATATTTPVIIVPGIMGSKLLEDNVADDLVWLNTIEIVVSISDIFLDVLKMNSDGSPTNESIIAGDVIRSLNGTDYFQGLSDKLNSSGYALNSDLFENSYDWRLDISRTASDVETAAILSLKEKIEEIKIQRGVDKVNLVAHSMGGLLVKKYLKDYGGDSVEKFIDIGTPHTGSPLAYKILMYGDNLGVSKFFGLVNINANRIKEISQNMPAVYQLLPSREYFDDTDIDYSYYVLDATEGNDRLTYEETNTYLNASGRNGSLVTRADEFHQEIDNLNPADYGVETYNFVGCGTPTIGQFYILEDGEHPIYNIKMINGDGTVPLKSAEALTASSTYYVRSAQHATMPSTSGVKDLIAEILNSTSTDPLDISAYSNIRTDSAGCTIPDGKIVSFHSPIDLHIYDSSGNHTGPDENGDIENEILGVVYEMIDGNKFAYLPTGTNYIIKGNATDAGTFDVRIQEIVGGEVTTTTVFADLPLTSVTQAQFSISTSTPAQIELDSNNDGTYESSGSITTEVAGILEGTGKVATPSDSPLAGGEESVSTTSSRPMVTFATQLFVPEMATTTVSTDSITSTNSPEVTPVIQITPPAPPRQVEENIATSSPPEQSQNTAIVYKSFTNKVSSAIKKFWFWIKSKL